MDPDIIISPDTQRSNRIPPGLKQTDRWPILHYGSIPNIDLSAWRFRIFGMVGQEKELTWEEFGTLPRLKVFSDIHCVTGWSRLNNLWEGVSSVVVAGLVELDPRARYVMVYGAGGFSTNIPLADFFQPDVLFAFSHDGEPLEASHGSPLRLVVPRLYFWKSAKWATGIEFMEQDRPGFWEQNGYHMHGDPWKEERFRDPRLFGGRS